MVSNVYTLLSPARPKTNNPNRSTPTSMHHLRQGSAATRLLCIQATLRFELSMLTKAPEHCLPCERECIVIWVHHPQLVEANQFVHWVERILEDMSYLQALPYCSSQSHPVVVLMC